jgi:hypothetical protein
VTLLLTFGSLEDTHRTDRLQNPTLTEFGLLEARFVVVDEARDANVVVITRRADTALLRQDTARDGIVVAHPLDVV